jgi:uncharacterized protein YuzE
LNKPGLLNQTLKRTGTTLRAFCGAVIKAIGGVVRSAQLRVTPPRSTQGYRGIVLDYDAEGQLVGIDTDNASKKVELKKLTLNKLPTSEQIIAA